MHTTTLFVKLDLSINFVYKSLVPVVLDHSDRHIISNTYSCRKMSAITFLNLAPFLQNLSTHDKLDFFVCFLLCKKKRLILVKL